MKLFYRNYRDRFDKNHPLVTSSYILDDMRKTMQEIYDNEHRLSKIKHDKASLEGISPEDCHTLIDIIFDKNFDYHYPNRSSDGKINLFAYDIICKTLGNYLLAAHSYESTKETIDKLSFRNIWLRTHFDFTIGVTLKEKVDDKL